MIKLFYKQRDQDSFGNTTINHYVKYRHEVRVMFQDREFRETIEYIFRLVSEYSRNYNSVYNLENLELSDILTKGNVTVSELEILDKDIQKHVREKAQELRSFLERISALEFEGR